MKPVLQPLVLECLYLLLDCCCYTAPAPRPRLPNSFSGEAGWGGSVYGAISQRSLGNEHLPQDMLGGRSLPLESPSCLRPTLGSIFGDL